MNGRRSNIEVIADILRIGEASKTHIMYQVGMSYAQLQKYLDYLVARGFLVRSTDRYPGGVYRVTRDGERLLGWIEKIEELLTLGGGIESVENVSQSLSTRTSKIGKRPVRQKEFEEDDQAEASRPDDDPLFAIAGRDYTPRYRW